MRELIKVTFAYVVFLFFFLGGKIYTTHNSTFLGGGGTCYVGLRTLVS